MQAQTKLLQPGSSKPAAPTAPLQTTCRPASHTLTAGQDKPETRPSTSTAADHIQPEDPSNYTRPENDNLLYNLWTFGELRLLVRCRIHGNIRGKNQDMYYVNLRPKMEYQPHFGLEQVTLSETARDWVASYIRNNCKLVRGRVNAYTSEIMVLDKLDTSQILYPRCPFDPTPAMAVVYGALETLNRLPVGQYLLSHTPGNTHALIKKSVENTRGSGVYDLHFAHRGYLKDEAGKPGPVPWIPIDPSLFLPFHKKNNKIPATFDPMKGPSPSTGKGKKKKRKNRNKSNKQQSLPTGQKTGEA